MCEIELNSSQYKNHKLIFVSLVRWSSCTGYGVFVAVFANQCQQLDFTWNVYTT